METARLISLLGQVPNSHYMQNDGLELCWFLTAHNRPTTINCVVTRFFWRRENHKRSRKFLASAKYTFAKQLGTKNRSFIQYLVSVI